MGLVLGSVPGVAFATTGPPTGQQLPRPRYRVDHKVAALYSGQYVLVAVAGGAHLRSAQIAMSINALGSLQGSGQFFGYDAQGVQTSWVALLYNFHPIAHGAMIIDLLGPTGSPLLGRLVVQRTQKGDLFGRITLGRHSYPIKWRKTLSL
jgi:hypothetical protein